MIIYLTFDSVEKLRRSTCYKCIDREKNQEFVASVTLMSYDVYRKILSNINIYYKFYIRISES